MPRDADEMEFLRARLATPFDLSAETPTRFELIRRAGTDAAIVLFVVHHIAIDGLSATFVARAFWDAYLSVSLMGESRRPRPKPADFREFVAFERTHLASAMVPLSSLIGRSASPMRRLCSTCRRTGWSIPRVR